MPNAVNFLQFTPWVVFFYLEGPKQHGNRKLSGGFFGIFYQAGEIKHDKSWLVRMISAPLTRKKMVAGL